MRAKLRFEVVRRSAGAVPRREILQARSAAYCKQEVEQTRRRSLAGDVFVFLSDQPRQKELAPDITCLPFSWARYCKKKDKRDKARDLDFSGP